MQDKRPDPDRILHQIQQQEADAAHVRGRLKIFFGYAAGVGKTYAMLEAAHAALAAGTDVVAGYRASHASGYARPAGGTGTASSAVRGIQKCDATRI